MVDGNYILDGKKGKQSKFIKVNFPEMVPKGRLVTPTVKFGNGKFKNNGKNYPQSKFLKKYKQNDYALFSDSDGDRVVNGMDCFAFDRNRHGVISWALKKIPFTRKYGESIERGEQIQKGSYKDTEKREYDIPSSQREQYQEDLKQVKSVKEQEAKLKKEYDDAQEKLEKEKAEREKIKEELEAKEKERKEKLEAMGNIGNEEAQRIKDLSRFRTFKQRIQVDLERNKQRIEKEKADKADPQTIQGLEKMQNELERNKRSYEGAIAQLSVNKPAIKKKILETETEALNREIKNLDQGYKSKRINDDFVQQKEKSYNEAKDKVKQQSEILKKYPKKYTPLERVGMTFAEWGENAKRSVSRSTGYLFETPERRKEYKVEDVKKEINYILPRLENESYSSVSSRYEKLKNTKDLSALGSLSSFGKEARNLEQERKRTSLLQSQASRDYARYQRELSKENIRTVGFEYESKRKIAEQNIAMAKRNIEMLQSRKQGGFYSTPKEMNYASDVNSWIKSNNNDLIPTQKQYIPKPDQGGYFSSTAPNYRYVKDEMSFTRKSSRRAPEESEYELPGTTTNPLIRTKTGNYPWTKPMKGYRREIVSYGRTVRKGRRKLTTKQKSAIRSKSGMMKRGFVPFESTYGLKGKKAPKSKLRFL